MTTEELKIGDFVKLKTGGPIMTINNISAGKIYCAWFVGNKLHEGKFHTDALYKMSEKELKNEEK